MYQVEVNDIQQWRTTARDLLRRVIPPELVAWQSHSALTLDFAAQAFASLPVINTNPKITPDFLELLPRVSCYLSDDKWALLYSLAYRLVYENRQLLDDSLDPQVRRLRHMQQTIGRDIHKMEAFVRFQKVERNNEPDIYLAWFEPEHDIFAAAAPFFVNRFNNMHWSILSPQVCMHWDQHVLRFSAGLPRPQGLNDECEQLWQEYYRSIFNPARLKIKAMQSEMPKKYWRNLPEAPLIKELIGQAQATTDAYIANTTSSEIQKPQKSKIAQNTQRQLRHNKNSQQ